MHLHNWCFPIRILGDLKESNNVMLTFVKEKMGQYREYSGNYIITNFKIH